jgi:hypothetical protein
MPSENLNICSVENVWIEYRYHVAEYIYWLEYFSFWITKLLIDLEK